MKKYLVTEQWIEWCETFTGYTYGAREEPVPPNARVLTKAEFVQKYIAHSESPFAKEKAHELWAAFGKEE